MLVEIIELLDPVQQSAEAHTAPHMFPTSTTGYEPNAESPTEMTADQLLDLYPQQRALQEQQASPHGAVPVPSSGPLALAPMSSDLAPSPIAVQALTQTFAPTSSTLALPSSAPQTLVQAFAQQ